MHKNFSSDRKVLEDAIQEMTKINPPEGQLWVDFSQSGPPSVLVKPDANDWSSRMQMCGQVECNYPAEFPTLKRM
jgi:hypothetical protein